MPGTELEVTEVHSTHPMWVQIAIPYRSPPAFLKVAGDELANNFDA
jgi:hypothetical protein